MYGDRFYWDQIFFNLIENALKQNPNPGLKISVWVIKESEKGPLTSQPGKRTAFTILLPDPKEPRSP